MKWVVLTGAFGGALLFASWSFAQSGFTASRASTQALPEASPEDLDFDQTVAREEKLIAFTRRLAAEQEARESQEFESSVARYVKLADFMRRLEKEREEQAAADFETKLALSARVQHFMQKLVDRDLHQTLAPEPMEWIRTRPAPSR